MTQNPFETPTAGSPSSSGSIATNPVANGSIDNRTMPPRGTSTAVRDSDALSEELPPAYTPVADVRQGEQSVAFGPTRPFQQRQQQQPRPALGGSQWQAQPTWHRPATSGWQAAWGGYPGQLHRSATSATHMRTGSSGSRMPPPPPQHPSLSPTRELFPAFGALQRRSSYAPPPGPPPHLAQFSPAPVPPPPPSEFARDFYEAGAGDTGVMGGVPGQYSTPTSPSDPRGPQPATPPLPKNTTSNGIPDVPDDGRPTTTPIPGHPLLNNGKVLVYPAGYECSKCTSGLIIICASFSN